MEIYFIFITAVLILLAISDLIVGVSNDAVNFLNSSIGSKAAPFRWIMITAAAGILVGATFSSGMMEVARKGIFHPDQFFFGEIMIIFLAVMITDVLLLDMFNTFGLPTSTTVSVVFELLGSAVAVSIIKIRQAGEAFSNMSNYINTSSALLIISGILLSVVIAFVVGLSIQWIVRIAFTFNYEKMYRYLASIWGGLAISIITYFIVIKGAKGSSLIPSDTVTWIKEHTWTILLVSMAGWSIILQLLLFFTKINVLKVIVLIGTFALAMAFAGNDLVNFIGVPLAGLESFKTFADSGLSDSSALAMTALAGPVKTPTYFLLAAGLIMVVTLFLSKKAKSVTQTEISLSRQDEGYERFNSTALARSILRGSIQLGSVFSKISSKPVAQFINKRFDSKAFALRKKKENLSFDLVRASVNLVVASALISLATSLKLPLSTTYVTFMVAMGTSLADRAWGRESAVYRITGVITVIGGWFFTALSAFTVSFLLALLIYAGGFIAITILILIAGFIILKTHGLHRKRSHREKSLIEEDSLLTNADGTTVIDSCTKNVKKILTVVPTLYEQSLEALTEMKRKKSKKILKDVNELSNSTRRLKNNLPKVISKLQIDDVETGHHYVQVVDYLRETVNCLTFISQPIFEYIDNNHAPPPRSQIEEIKELSSQLKKFFKEILNLLESGVFEDMEKLSQQQRDLLELITRNNKRLLKRIKNKETGTKNSTLYMNILSESKNLLLHALHLIKAQRAFLHYSINNGIVVNTKN